MFKKVHRKDQRIGQNSHLRTATRINVSLTLNLGVRQLPVGFVHQVAVGEACNIYDRCRKAVELRAHIDGALVSAPDGLPQKVLGGQTEAVVKEGCSGLENTKRLSVRITPINDECKPGDG